MSLRVNTCFFSVWLEICGGENTFVLEGTGEFFPFFFLFWSSVFDLLLGATVNTVAVTTAEERKHKHIM